MIFDLAFNLRMTVAEVMHEMSFEEYQKWFIYFKERPIGWREDDRTAKLMRTFGSSAQPEEIFDSLKRLKEGYNQRKSETDKGLRSSVFFVNMMNAKGGDKLEL